MFLIHQNDFRHFYLYYFSGSGFPQSCDLNGLLNRLDPSPVRTLPLSSIPAHKINYNPFSVWFLIGEE